MYAPLTWLSARASWSTRLPPSARARRCRITSVSEEDWKTAPSASSWRLKSSALIRLPLCAMATGPWAVVAVMGWALRVSNLPGGRGKPVRRVVMEHCTVKGKGLLDLADFSSQHPCDVQVIFPATRDEIRVAGPEFRGEILWVTVVGAWDTEDTWGRIFQQMGRRYEAPRLVLFRGRVNAAASIGDDRLQQQSLGTVRPESFTHGSSAQRARLFRAGFESGDPGQCDTFTAREP